MNLEARLFSLVIARLRRSWKTYLGLLISLACIWWVVTWVEGQQVVNHIKNADLGLLLLAALTTCASYGLRAWRWRFFFESQPPGFSDSYRCLILGFFMNNVLPARMGELVRAHLGGRATGQSRSVVLATIAGERLADGLMISLIFALLFSFGASPDEIERVHKLYYVVYFFLFAAVLTGVILVCRARIFSFLQSLGRIMPGHLSHYTLVRIERFIIGLEPLLKPSRLIILAFASLVIWLVELFVYYQVAVAFNIPMSLGGLSLFLAAVNFSSLIPAAPGAIGVIEAIATVALVKIGIEKESAFSMVAMQHFIQYSVVGVPGLYFFLRMRGKMPEPEPEMDDEPELASDRKEFVDVSGPRPREKRDDALQSGVTADEKLKGELLEISVIIPAYNEENRLPKTLISTLQYFAKSGRSFEVIVVDDGSTDGTAHVVHQFAALSPHIRLLVYPKNRGKGYAVRFGVLNARGKLILFCDADGSSPIEEVQRLEDAITAGADLAIGSRAMFSRETKIETVWHRRLMGRVFNGIVNLVLLPGIADTQCGFKLFRDSVAHQIFSKQRAERFSFDVEILFLARRHGFQIAEVPINWVNVPGSKVDLCRDSISMFFDVLKIRFRDLLGGYR